MRRSAIASLLLVTVTAVGCSSGSTTQRTVTVVNTVSGSSAAASGPKTTGSVIVVSPSSTGAASSAPASTPKPTPKPTPTSVKPAPIVKIDPLKADCNSTLDASDIKKAINATVGTKTNRIRLGAGDKGATGAIRCFYGSTDNGKSAPVRIRLTKYNTAAAAKKQVDVDVSSAQDAGAKISKTTVAGYPATLQIIAGGVIEMQYDTWTLSVAASDKVASAAALTKGLPVLANQALLRIIKNA
jgi:hypothetical protein